MNTAQANALAAILVGFYLLAANLRFDGKARMQKLLGLLSQEAGFIKWGIAVSVLWWLATRKEIGEIGAGLIVMAVLILAIRVANDPTIVASIASTWKALPATSTKGT